MKAKHQITKWETRRVESHYTKSNTSRNQVHFSVVSLQRFVKAKKNYRSNYRTSWDDEKLTVQSMVQWCWEHTLHCCPSQLYRSWFWYMDPPTEHQCTQQTRHSYQVWLIHELRTNHAGKSLRMRQHSSAESQTASETDRWFLPVVFCDGSGASPDLLHQFYSRSWNDLHVTPVNVVHSCRYIIYILDTDSGRFPLAIE